MTDDNVVQLPPPEKPPELLIGPFEVWKVQVDGRIIPRLTGWKEGDETWLCVDNRFAQGFKTEEDARGAAVLIAQASAVASGYPHMGAETKDMPFAPIGCGIGSVDEVPKP